MISNQTIELQQESRALSPKEPPRDAGVGLHIQSGYWVIQIRHWVSAILVI